MNYIMDFPIKNHDFTFLLITSNASDKQYQIPLSLFTYLIFCNQNSVICSLHLVSSVHKFTSCYQSLLSSLTTPAINTCIVNSNGDIRQPCLGHWTVKVILHTSVLLLHVITKLSFASSFTLNTFICIFVHHFTPLI